MKNIRQKKKRGTLKEKHQGSSQIRKPLKIIVETILEKVKMEDTVKPQPQKTNRKGNTQL